MIRRKYILGPVVVIFLATALLLTLLFDRQTSADVVGEPLDAYTKSQFEGTHLDFIAETGRVVVNENGSRQIIWDPPQLPTLEESISMVAAAREADDSSLLPLCTEEYRQYVKEQKGIGEQASELLTDSKPPGFPICKAIPESIVFGPARDPAR